MRRLPPLSTLPVLEAAARLASFSAAAEELHVTHGAISHQIRSLEDHLGVRLFAREGRRVTVTPDGAALAEQVRQALAQIASAVEAISPKARESRLTVSVLPSFASRWLMRHMGGFLEKHPELEIHVQATIGLANFTSDGVDVAIRFGKGPWPGVHVERIAGDSHFVVCSPEFMKKHKPKTVVDLVKLPLVRADFEDWARWFKAAGVDQVPRMKGVEYNDAAMVLQAAMDGQGLALTRRSLAESDLAKGRLVRPFDVEIAAQESYFLVCLPQHRHSRKITAFRDWLFSEIEWESPGSHANRTTVVEDFDHEKLPPAPKVHEGLKQSAKPRGATPKVARLEKRK
ncbi:MAG: transcriptional regulator GcvA [Betaproteobacteria bacterium]|nr:transcriptional regulator GcvA [Betaproteobacteria bacterium]